MRLFQGDGSEEGGWYLHNAVRHDDVLFHPECHKDINKVGQVETSVVTTIETMDTTETEQKVDLVESIGNILERVEEEDVEMKPDVKVKVPPDIDTDKEEFLAIRSFSLGWEDFVFELNLGIPISFESKR